MPTTVNGIGTKFYGEADLRPDASYITTEWAVICHIPVIPLRSLRVVRDKASDEKDFFEGHIAAYRVLEKMPLYWRQVSTTYLFVIGCAAWWVASAWLFFVKHRVLDGRYAIGLMFMFVVVASAPFFVVWWVRRENYKSRHGDR